MKAVKFLGVCAVIVLLMAVPLVAFYSSYERVAAHLRHDLGYDGSAANAVKHSYAAAGAYNILSVILGSTLAEKAVMGLGYMNEYAELITKYRKPDSLEEVLKDTFNNLAGAMVAECRQKEGQSTSVLETLKDLAKRKILITAREDAVKLYPLPEETDNRVPTARAWLSQNLPAIRQRILSGMGNKC